MARLIFFVFILIISGIVFLLKAGFQKVTGREVTTFSEESQRVLHSTAKGINWMNDQWERAKQGGSAPQAQLKSGHIKFQNMTAIELITRIKADTSLSQVEKESMYINAGVNKMQNRQFDDAVKLISQLSPGEARDYMLNEIVTARRS